VGVRIDEARNEGQASAVNDGQAPPWRQVAADRSDYSLRHRDVSVLKRSYPVEHANVDDQEVRAGLLLLLCQASGQRSHDNDKNYSNNSPVFSHNQCHPFRVRLREAL